VKSKKTIVRKTPHFFRPKTLVHPKKPQVPTRLVEKRRKFTDARLVKMPLTTEAAMSKIELCNTIVFLCDRLATKPQIKAAVSRMLNAKVIKVNTLNRLEGDKKAFVKFDPSVDALEMANKLGMV